MADRCYCPEPPIDGRFALEDDEARHLVRVRRVRVGEVVEVFDGRGFATRAEVVALGRDRVDLAAVGGPLADRVAACRLTLATAVPKGERFDWLVEKATELGVARLVPIVAERSLVDPRGQARQAPAAGHRGLEAVREEPTDGAGPARPLGGILRGSRTNGRGCWPIRVGYPPRLGPARRLGAVALAVGPEGGFTDAEVETARALGWTAIGIGATLLRIETAGLAGCSAILALCEGTDE